MNSSFPDRWPFSYLNVTNTCHSHIGEPKYKYRQQELVTVRNHNRRIALERSVLKYWGLKPVLQNPNLALRFWKNHRSFGSMIRLYHIPSNPSRLHNPFQNYGNLSRQCIQIKYYVTSVLCIFKMFICFESQ